MKNELESFQRAMDTILAFVLWQFAVFYLENIVIFSKSPSDHTKQVRCMLWLLYEAGVNLKLKKCKFFAVTTDA